MVGENRVERRQRDRLFHQHTNDNTSGPDTPGRMMTVPPLTIRVAATIVRACLRAECCDAMHMSGVCTLPHEQPSVCSIPSKDFGVDAIMDGG